MQREIKTGRYTPNCAAILGDGGRFATSADAETMGADAYYPGLREAVCDSPT
jgi:hypothetical protein